MRRRSDHTTLFQLAGLVVATALVPARDVWAVSVLLLALWLTIPGLALLRAMGVPSATVAGFPLYAVAASLVFISFTGLAVNGIAPSLGADAPLRTAPLLIGLDVVGVLAVIAGALRSPDWTLGVAALRARWLWPLGLPLLSAAGAQLLTNGHGSAIAVTSAVVAAVALVLATLRADRLAPAHLSLILYGFGLAALWAFALRSRFVYGFDIATEFNVAGSVHDAGIWQALHRDDSYGAMLSLTVLPSALAEVTGAPVLVLLKIVYPALMAFFPVGLFLLASRFLERRYAFMAAAFVASQYYFFQLLPAIARQEIGFLLFLALMAVLFESGLRTRVQIRLAVLFGLGTVVSHYSTAYLTIIVLVVALIVELAASRLRPKAGFAAVLVATLSVAGGAFVWYGPVTHSSQNLSKFAKSIKRQGLDVLPNSKAGQNPIAAYLSGNVTGSSKPAEYQRRVAAVYRQDRPYVHPLAAADDPRYALQPAVVPDLGGSDAVANLFKAGGTAISQLANLLAILGALLLVFGRSRSVRERRLGAIALGTLLSLVLIRLSGTTANAYNQERAYLQLFVPLSIVLGIAVQFVARRWRRTSAPIIVGASLAVGLLFVNGIGLQRVIAGGNRPLSLANTGEDFQRFSVLESELAAGGFIGARPDKALIYADRYGALRVLGATGRIKGLLQDVTPRTLDHSAWVFASRSNLIDGQARAQLEGRFVTYAWPSYLDDQFDRVYSAGPAAVYHGTDIDTSRVRASNSASRGTP